MTEALSDDPSERRADVAVVGAGLAGLSAAIEAADAGARVIVFDARDSIGGRARTHVRQGYALNEGAHALYVDGAAMAFLTELGCEPAGGVPDAGAGVGVDGDLAAAFPVGLVSLLRTPLLRGDRIAMAKLFARLPRIDPADHGTTTVDDAIRRLLGRGRAARLATALFRLSTYFNDPARTSADAGLMQLRMSLAGGVRYVDGGWQTMIDDLEKIAVGRGVEIRSGAKVDRVAPAPAGHVVSTAAGTVAADRVIVAGPVTMAADLLGDAAPSVRGWASGARPATVASLDVGFPDPWGDRHPFALGLDEPTYLSVHAPVADLAPRGHTLVHVMRYHPDAEAPEPERDRAACERLLDRVRPDWRARADHVSFRPRLVASSDQPAADRGGLAGRPAVAVPGTTGVFVAGDWVGPDGILADAAVASGRSAGRAAS